MGNTFWGSQEGTALCGGELGLFIYKTELSFSSVIKAEAVLAKCIHNLKF